jgi:cell division septum initiation protein DivIVA
MTTDNRMNRVKVMLGGASPDGETSEHSLVAPPAAAAGPQHPNQALQVLTMAQRTAEEHVQTARAQADRIRTEALAAAEQTAREAEQHAHNVRREADKVLFEARAAAENAAREAQARAEAGQRNAEKIELDGRARAEAIAADAQAKAEELKQQAHRRYDELVGSLGAKREALQAQIEALEQFDREYRNRLTNFMQSQLRSLWVDQPQVTAELDHSAAHAAVVPAPASHAAPEVDAAPQEQDEPAAEAVAMIPAQRQSPEQESEEEPEQAER